MTTKMTMIKNTNKNNTDKTININDLINLLGEPTEDDINRVKSILMKSKKDTEEKICIQQNILTKQ